jgi:hypothetical protein
MACFKNAVRFLSVICLLHSLARGADAKDIPVKHFISHVHYDFTSPLKLIEDHFGLKPLADRDRDASNMLDCFDFAQKPNAPEVLDRSTKLAF